MEPRDRGVGPERPDYLVVGRIGRAHGVRGEVRVDVQTDFPERRFRPGTRLFVGREGDHDPRRMVVASARPHAGYLLVRFDVAVDRTSAEELVGLVAMVPLGEAAELEPDAYYEHQLVGLEVVTDAGVTLGHVSELMETGSADVLVVTAAEGRTYLLPMTGEVIAAVDLAAGRLTVTPLPGLLD